MIRPGRGTILFAAALALAGCTRSEAKRKAAKATVRFVTVQPDVRLEVLDWGGSGRALVLLAGSGNSAYVFDELAPKLTACCRVYAISRRGYGASSQPASGYDEQRLADDVLAVLDGLNIEAPVLIGHSMAGNEITTLARQHPTRVSGLVYLDALGDPKDFPSSDPEHQKLLAKLPRPPEPSPPCQPDTESFAGYRAWQLCTGGFAFPESELRSGFATNPDGSMGRYKTPRSIHEAIGDGAMKRDYNGIRVPVLVLAELPLPGDPPFRPGDPPPKNADERAALIAFRDNLKPYVDRWIASLKRAVPDARVVDVPGGGHFLFFTQEAKVLREVRAFVTVVAEHERQRSRR